MNQAQLLHRMSRDEKSADNCCHHGVKLVLAACNGFDPKDEKWFPVWQRRVTVKGQLMLRGCPVSYSEGPQGEQRDQALWIRP